MKTFQLLTLNNFNKISSCFNKLQTVVSSLHLVVMTLQYTTHLSLDKVAVTIKMSASWS